MTKPVAVVVGVGPGLGSAGADQVVDSQPRSPMRMDGGSITASGRPMGRAAPRDP